MFATSFGAFLKVNLGNKVLNKYTVVQQNMRYLSVIHEFCSFFLLSIHQMNIHLNYLLK